MNRLAKNRLLVLGGLAFGVLFALGLWQALSRPPAFRGALLEPVQPAPPLQLQSATGEPFRLADYRGKVVLLFFGYTSCPDVCPTTLAEMRRLYHNLERPADVQIVFVTVDPARDTPERLATYVQRFDPSFLALTGTQDALQAVWDAYGVYREEQEVDSAAGYLVAHTARVYAIDKAGNLRLTFAFGTSAEDIEHDVKILLQERVVP